MAIKGFLSKFIARQITKDIYAWSQHPIETQYRQFRQLVESAIDTDFGEEHDFASIESYDDFRQRVPIRDYEQFKPYVERIIDGGENVLWPGRPIYFAKTSGTTSGTKYIPITRDSISNHIDSARNALLSYIQDTGRSFFFDGKMIFLSGSPELDEKGGTKTGRLSGIVNHHVPKVLRTNQLPSYSTNCIDEWEHKLEHIVEETVDQDMRLISGIPPWVQMYFDYLHERTGKLIKDIFPNFNLLVHGGVNFEPYREKMMQTIGKEIDSIETYPASEGFIAFQDKQHEPGLLLVLNKGIFYEFVKADEIFNENPHRISLKDVEVGVNYALILNTNAGLWGYNLGDTVKFISTEPYKLVVTGRTKHFISAFGEHVIAEEVDEAMAETARETGARITEFHVAPQVNPPEGGTPFHEWFIEFKKSPEQLSDFSEQLDHKLREKNIYYDDLISGGILKPLVICEIPPNGFNNYMKSMGKLGGQNKVPRLSNDRKFAEGLRKIVVQ